MSKILVVLAIAYLASVHSFPFPKGPNGPTNSSQTVKIRANMSKILLVLVIVYFASVYSSPFLGGVINQPPNGNCECMEGVHHQCDHDPCAGAICNLMRSCCVCNCQSAVCKVVGWGF
ncbi:hypothetical protein ACROYT_G018883 [Oculina patagonica]